jgi:phage terminase large subunit-like protein
VAGAWLSVDALDNCPSDLDPAQLEGRECWAGLDLSATDDTTALALLFPHLDDDGVDVLSFFWLPEDNITALEKKHRVSYRAWARQKLFRLTPGNVVDYQAIRQEIGELAKVYPIKRLAIDRKFQGQQLETELMEDGFDVVPTGGGWISQDIPAKELERLTKAKRFNYGGHPVMRWHLSNVVVEIDKNENYSLSKKRSRSKIDGAVAVTMGLFAMMNDRSTAGSSYYEENPEPILI